MALFEYQFEKSEIVGIGETYHFPKIDSKYGYYDQRGRYIYYSAENGSLKLSDAGFRNLFTEETIWISNSHSNKLTGMAHYDENTLFSASKAGDIKVWTNSP
jgi:hypothetical protein